MNSATTATNSESLSYENCCLCPRSCGVNRRLRKGYCQSPAQAVAARAALHFWEEPCISGLHGSGTVFFSGCTLRCCFCQNYRISSEGFGKAVTAGRLAEIFLELQAQGAHNINLVTATQYLPTVLQALQDARPRLTIPVVYNCGGYETIDAVNALAPYVDIWLPDLKYLNPENARRYSRAPDYPERAREALDEMVRQSGSPRFDEKGMMTRGVIVRHLLLPGCLKDAKHIVRYLYHRYGNRIYISLMNQYTPMESLDVKTYPELGVRVSERAYRQLVDYALELGVEQAFIQEGETAKESFIPPFTLEGVLPADHAEKEGKESGTDVLI